MREKLIEILRVPIYPHELADLTEVVADYLLDNDVVPVVRCKDCTHGKVHGSFYICKNIHVGSYGWGMRKNDFCSCGERRTDDERTG